MPKLLDQVRELIRARHYSYRTEHNARVLFNGHGLGQVPWLIYVATAANGNVIGEQL
jgi:hypothetical protein